MLVTFKNRSNKLISRTRVVFLKRFARLMACTLEIDRRINLIDLRLTKDWHGYYPKGEPLGGLIKLYHNKIVRIDLTRHWDTSLLMNKEAIIHELTHAKQLIEKRLVINRTRTEAKWLGKKVVTWKKFRVARLNELPTKRSWAYTERLIPWEREVRTNVQKYKRVTWKQSA